jgi:4-deoxy-L-threo-5-hexosulose-uronate ketol-isomerase
LRKRLHKMAVKTESRFAVHPHHASGMDTNQLRGHFLIEELFLDNTIRAVYSHHDRLIVGGVKPTNKAEVQLETFNDLKSNYFLERREIGIINIGATGVVRVNEKDFILNNKEALYIGRGVERVSFLSQSQTPALFYFNSATAHQAHPTKKVTLSDAENLSVGSSENANKRTIRKLLVRGVVDTCQLQMGLTDLEPGSIWNTMPPHTHDRRMEAYFYFNIKPNETVCHFMGEPTETRHLWIQNNQAVISPPWSIHSGVGTSNYSFIWGMAGENLDYGDMDQIMPSELR